MTSGGVGRRGPSGYHGKSGGGGGASRTGGDGLATFNTTLEEGHGTIRAFAHYEVEP